MAVKIYDAQAGIYYYINNHLGTPQQMVDIAGTVVWQADYLPFGKAEVDPSSTVENNIRFPGQYYDEESGLHYNWHRYYDPSTGRYMTPDPIGLKGGINLYSYVSQNPINSTDPTGLIDPVVTVGVTWLVLYLTHTGDMISDDTGNVWGEPNPEGQDQVCTLPWPIGPIADQCILERCQGHDQCFEENECNASSWVSSLLGGTKPCNECNSNF